MGIKQRVSWSDEEKCHYIKMYETPLANGQLMGKSEFAEMYGIAEKTFYRWHKCYEMKGLDGLKSEPRKLRESRVHNSHLEIEVLEIANAQPGLSASSIIQNLSRYKKPVSIPTVQEILNANALGTLSSRYANIEKKYVLGSRKLEEQLFQTLKINNPYLKLLKPNSEFIGLNFHLSAFRINYYFTDQPGYVLFGIETNSFFTYLYYWDGLDKGELNDFIKGVISFSDPTNSIPIQINFSEDFPNLKFASNDERIQYTKVNKDFSKLLKPLILNLKKEYIKPHIWKDVEQFRMALSGASLAIMARNITKGYPQFGSSSYDAFRNHKERFRV
jgi:transposase-like protein